MQAVQPESVYLLNTFSNSLTHDCLFVIFGFIGFQNNLSVLNLTQSTLEVYLPPYVQALDWYEKNSDVITLGLEKQNPSKIV